MCVYISIVIITNLINTIIVIEYYKENFQFLKEKKDFHILNTNCTKLYLHRTKDKYFLKSLYNIYKSYSLKNIIKLIVFFLSQFGVAATAKIYNGGNKEVYYAIAKFAF